MSKFIELTDDRDGNKFIINVNSIFKFKNIENRCAIIFRDFDRFDTFVKESYEQVKMLLLTNKNLF